MIRVLLIGCLLALGGCAGSLKYQHAKRHQYIPSVQMDAVYITSEVNNVKPMLKLCDRDRRQNSHR